MDIELHIVEEGETWASLAAEYGVSVRILKALNPHVRHDEELFAWLRIEVPIKAENDIILLDEESGVVLFRDTSNWPEYDQIKTVPQAGQVVDYVEGYLRV